MAEIAGRGLTRGAAALAAALAIVSPARAFDACETPLSPVFSAAPEATLRIARRLRVAAQGRALREARATQTQRPCDSIACPGVIILGVGY
ncbi:hypothetical protein [Methylocella sp.]|uniref:hypothetical protein n=1 Tax=Methylocella sp. TaxID=1978226 RepID=UPI0035AE0272